MRDENLCCLCGKAIDKTTADVLTMGGYGNPRYLCDECASTIECATTSRDVAEAKGAIATLGELLPAAAEGDRAVFRTMNSLLSSAVERAEKIEAGTYDFSLDEAEDSESFDEIPEELLETEEDRELDERDEQAQKKFDKIFNIITTSVIFGVLVAVIIIRLIFK